MGVLFSTVGNHSVGSGTYCSGARPLLSPVFMVARPSLVSEFSLPRSSEDRMATAVYKMLCDQPSGTVQEPRIVEQMSWA